MTRTYWIEHRDCFGRKHYDKLTHRSHEDRPRWHRVEALDLWKKNHPGHGKLTIEAVRTREEMKAKGLL